MHSNLASPVITNTESNKEERKKTSDNQIEDDIEKHQLLTEALPKLKAIQARYPTLNPLKLMRRYKKFEAELEKAAERHMLQEAAAGGDDLSRLSLAYTTANSFRQNQAKKAKKYPRKQASSILYKI
jgi:hypothetical protein